MLVLLLIDKASAEKLSVQVNEAVQLLTDYNSRLASEMEYRKKLTTMLKDFLQAQKDLLAQAEHRLEVKIFTFKQVVVYKENLLSDGLELDTEVLY